MKKKVLLAKSVSSFMGVGLIKGPRGTYGTVAAIALLWPLADHLGGLISWFGFFFLFMIGWLATEVTEKELNVHDPNWIVIDEVLAIFFCLLLAPGNSAVDFLLAFVFFRVFDIWKPYPIREIDQKLHSSFGTIIDDFAAAIYALVLHWGIYFFDLLPTLSK